MANDKIMWGEGYHSPQTILKSIDPFSRVFMSHPTNENDNTNEEGEIPTNGWGYPFTDEEGNVLPLGTLGAAHQIKYINKRKGEWARSNTPGTQVFGNIDWRGPVLETLDDGTELRLNLTWNGPQQRYFPDSRYDYAADKAYEVYYRGRYVCCAPLPVLGAAAKKEDGVWMLYVICKNSTADRVYRYRLQFSGFLGSTYTDEVREGFREPWHIDNNPLGYQIAYNVERQSVQGTVGHEIDEEALEARTPWFFNESCTKAVCMREVTATYVDTNSVEYSEISTSKYLMVIGSSEGGFSFEYGGNLGRMTWIEKHKYKLLPSSSTDFWCYYKCSYPAHPEYDTAKCGGDNITTHPDAPCSPGCTDLDLFHFYALFQLEQVRYMQGSQAIATDFDGDTQVTARIVIDNYRSHDHEFSYGVDCNTQYNAPLLNGTACNGTPNHDGVDTCVDEACANDGDPVCNQFPDLPPFYGNSSTSPWHSQRSLYTMKFKNTGGTKEFTVYEDMTGTEYEKNNDGESEDEFDTTLEYHGYTKRFVHFLDLRHPFIANYTELYLDEWITFTNPIPLGYAAPEADLTTQLFQREAYAVDTDDSTIMSEVVLVDTKTTSPLLGYDNVGNGTAKVDIGGPDWIYSADATYTHTDGTDHYFATETHGLGWYDLETRNSDKDTLQPTFANWYGSLDINAWPAFISFFNNTQYDGILQKEIHLNYVEGGIAKNAEDWIFSYEAPSSAGDNDPQDVKGSGSGEYYCKINNEDALFITPGAAKMHPLGVF